MTEIVEVGGGWQGRAPSTLSSKTHLLIHTPTLHPSHRIHLTPHPQPSPPLSVQLFSAWLAPEVEVGVTPPAQHSAAQRAGSSSDSSSASACGSDNPGSCGLPEEAAPRVLLQARACRLVGSPAFESLEGRFALRFRTQLTWSGAGSAGSACAPMGPGAVSLASWDDWEEEEQEQEQEPEEEGSVGSSDSDSAASGAAGLPGQHAGAVGARSMAWEGSSPGLGAGSKGEGDQARQGDISNEITGQGVIRGHLVVAVWAEPIPPFHLIPRGALRRGSSAVLGALIKALLPLFMRR